MAWQVGVEEYDRQMKKITNRIKYIQTFVEDEQYKNQIREIARRTVLTPESCIGITDIRNYFEQMIAETNTQE